MRTVWTVFRKELLDGARDRRSIASLVFSAMIAPILFGVMFTVAAERRRGAEEIDLPVEGAAHAR
jgi:ABC-type Na+ efflux pump permease subunit